MRNSGDGTTLPWVFDSQMDGVVSDERLSTPAMDARGDSAPDKKKTGGSANSPNPVIAGAPSELSFFTIGRKITLAQIGVVLLALIVASVSFFVSVKSDLERLLGQRLESIARTSTLMMSGDDHEAVVKAFIEGGPEAAVKSEAFGRLKAAMQKVQKNNDLTSDVYTLISAERFNDMYDEEGRKALQGNMMFMAMATAKEPYVGNMMPIYDEVKEVLATGKFARKKLHTDSEGSWVSAFAPILDSQGKTVAVLEFDYNAGEEVAQANRQLMINILLPALFGLLVAVFLGAYIGKSLSSPIRSLADVADLVAGGNFDVSVDVTTRDETGALGTVFNKMVADLKKQRLELQDYAQNLEKKIAERTAQLSDANRSIQGMVDSVGQGFFMFGKDGKCLSIYSRACADLLEGAPAGKFAWEALKISGDAQTDFLGWFPLLFEDMMPFEDVAGLGPKEFQGGTKGKYITLEYFPVKDDSGAVSRVVAIATDRTAERDANIRAEKQREYASMIMKLVKNKKQFSNLVNESRSYFAQLTEELAKSKPDLDAVFRTVHTFKSASASFSMGEVAHTAHEYESELVSLRKQAADGGSVEFKGWPEKIDALAKKFDAFLEENRAIIGGASGSDGPRVEIPLNAIREFSKQLEKTSRENKPILADFEKKFLSESLESLLGHFGDIVTLVATRQGKEVNSMKITGGDIRVMAEPFQPLFSSLVHAFRNAVDHGLELPDDRIEAGKTPTGNVELRLEREQQAGKTWLKIQVVDDGRGINPAIIREKLTQKGVKGLDRESDEEVIQHVFDAGFSTKDQVTDISGRGIGMDAIRAAAQDLGGSCRVSSFLGKGSVLEVCVPDPNPVI
jgi:two-component system chemotaxis sensor kinase CheA